MLRHPICSAFACSVVVALALCGCGESGSDPFQSAEARFEVHPTGQVTFRVDSLIGGGVSHSVANHEFTTTSTFAFVLESAAPPFGGKFTLTSGDQITVTLTVISGIKQTQVSDFATMPGTTAEVVIEGPLPTAMPGPGNPEVRFDICAPPSGQVSCSTTTGTGAFGVLFGGTIGDRFTSYLVSGTTPSIFFFEAPRENVNAVFTRQPVTGDLLVVGLSVNGQPVQTQADTGDVVLREDL